MLTKTKDQLHSANEKLHIFNTDTMTLQRYGFLLADAVCQSYNPKNATDEIERLIEVVRHEHIQLSESARVRLNPFQMPVQKSQENDSTPESNDQNTYKTIHSKFDELDHEFSTLVHQQCIT